MSRAVIVVVSVLLLVTPAAISGPKGHDDAGSGTDAGNSPETALVLPQDGSYNGDLEASNDSDWFKLALPQGEPACVEVGFRDGAIANATLAFDTALASSATRPLHPSITQELALAAPPGAEATYLGLEPRAFPWHNPQKTLSAGEYNFTIDVLTSSDLGPADGASGADAGDSLATAVPVEEGCFAGTLQFSELDSTDVYTFKGQAGDPLFFSLNEVANPVIELTLLDPNGTVVDIVTAGQVSEVALDQDGTWAFKVSLPGNQLPDVNRLDYTVGFTQNGPSPPPCQPSCFELVN